MDEIWKDLTLSTLVPSSDATRASGSGPGLFVFQDLLTCSSSSNVEGSCPSNEGPPENNRPYGINFSDAAGTVPPFFKALASPGICPCPGRKRVPANGEDAVDRKRKRLMKNRESAERSRARRQAYTYELEAEVSHLMEENADLRKQVEKLRFAASCGGDQPPKKQRIYRTSSCPNLMGKE